jgi:hypothetical protein
MQKVVIFISKGVILHVYATDPDTVITVIDEDDEKELAIFRENNEKSLEGLAHVW